MMRKQTQPAHAITGVFVFLLLGLFAVFSTVMVLLGAKGYQSTVNKLEAHNRARIAPSYIRSMVRAQDETARITVEEEAGVTAISMRAEYDGEGFITRIYCYDGNLYEWFSDEASAFEPENGETVCACDELTASLTAQGLLSVRLRSGEEWTNVDIALRALK